MKKLLISFLLLMAGFAFAQQYPVNNTYGNSGYSNNNYNNDNYDYPDDYYYDYPTDYYPQNYYQSYYNDYRNSIVSINWSKFFRKYRLNRYQIEEIIALNNRYQNFASWDYYYGSNPDRWYYERFYALQNILGPRIFVGFQNNYYHGYNPVVYFQNYRRTYYVPRYAVRTPYRNVNVVHYRVDRNTYKNPRANNGLSDATTRNRNTGFQDNNLSGNTVSTLQSNGFRSNSARETTQSTRNAAPTISTRNNGFRSNNNAQNTITPQKSQPKVSSRASGGFRTGSTSTRNTISAAPRSEQKTTKSSSTRGGGFR